MMPSGLPQRRSIRLQDYDYSQVGAYFVTLCAQDRSCLFGQILDGEVKLNSAGDMIAKIWSELPLFYQGVELDVSVVMPNHFHGILVLQDNPGRLALSDLLQRFKSLTSRLYSKGVQEEGWQPFRGRVWQRNFYEHIVRGPEDLDRLRRYIADNPMKWEMDSENPNRSA